MRFVFLLQPVPRNFLEADSSPFRHAGTRLDSRRFRSSISFERRIRRTRSISFDWKGLSSTEGISAWSSRTLGELPLFPSRF